MIRYRYHVALNNQLQVHHLTPLPTQAPPRKRASASLGMKPITDIFKHVILTSGTLAPMDTLPKLLGFQPLVTRSICVDANPRLLPVVVTRGNDQVRTTAH